MGFLCVRVRHCFLIYPKMSASPAVTDVIPVSMLKSVVFPAPL